LLHKVCSPGKSWLPTSTNMYLSTVCALKYVLCQIGYCHQTTPRTHMNSVLVGYQEQSFPQKVADSMRNNAIPFHFSKTKTPCSTSAVSWLSGDGNYRSSLPCIHFVIDQMSQSLIVDGSNKKQILQSFS
jgi:hypothetical protein